ncbi:MAG: DNA repair protein RadC [Bacteroidaceae bacterium]|nr:DNA repair protein RadC [Bacteroidaceae bacterium]
MTNGLSINRWAEEDRPREKMASKGAAALSDAELLAILIGSGNADESAVDLMRRVLSDCGNNLNALGKMEVSDLCGYKGIGSAKAITILAACELGKRRKSSDVQERARLVSAQDIYDYMHPQLQDLPHEECWVILMNSHLKVIETVCVSRGGLGSTVVDVRMVLREAILKRATTLVLCHNHPSGNVRPSREDDLLTSRLQQAAQTLDIRMLDHVIVVDGGYFSYNDEGRL